MEEERIEIMDLAQNVSVTEAQNRAEIDIQIATAHRFPRNTERAVQNVIATVTKDKELAQTCVYSLPRGGKTISGASVHLARLLASEYKNLRVDARIVEIGESMLTAQAVCLDLESNYAVRTEVKRKIIDKNKQRYSEDMIVMTCNAALSIASRNAILQVIPASAVNKVYKAAQNAIIGDVSSEQNLIKQRQEVLDAFRNNLNVSEAEILQLLQIETINQIKSEQLLVLVGLANAIHDGDTTVAEAFGRVKETEKMKETKAKVKEAIEKANEKLREKKSGTAAPKTAKAEPHDMEMFSPDQDQM